MEPELYSGAPQEAHERGTDDFQQMRKKLKYIMCHMGGLTGRDHLCSMSHTVHQVNLTQPWDLRRRRAALFLHEQTHSEKLEHFPAVTGLMKTRHSSHVWLWAG